MCDAFFLVHCKITRTFALRIPAFVIDGGGKKRVALSTPDSTIFSAVAAPPNSEPMRGTDTCGIHVYMFMMFVYVRSCLKRYCG